MVDLPTGTVTFLFTDIEGSTRLWEEEPAAMQRALARHDALLTAGIQERGGVVIKSRGEGDSFFAVFARASDAVAAALALQQALQAEPWPTSDPLRVRAALHTGEAELREGDYYGAAVSRCSRVRAAGHGGQILLSLTTQELVRDHLPEGVELRDLGQHRLKDLVRPEQLFQLLHPSLPGDFPPLRSLDARPNNLPAQLTPLISREQEAAAVRSLLQRPEVRLVTLTGPGGTGKTRLALHVAADLLDEFGDGAFFVPLATISDPGLVASVIARSVGVRELGAQPLRESLVDFLRGREMLLVLDNFEQVLPAAPLAAALLEAGPRLKLLVTSRAPLHLRGEQEFSVPPLSVPDPKHLPPLPILSQYAAVELFIQRAKSVQPGFTVSNENAPAVAEICARLDGLPLAIELAAARTRLLTPQAMLGRLESRLKLLTGGARDLPARQQTLRGAIAWSYDLLDPDAQCLFRRLSVFAGGATLEAIEAVCAKGNSPGVDPLDGISALVEQSLLQREGPNGTEPRLTMLETIREYGRECLVASGELEESRRAHAQYFLHMGEEASRHLRGPEQAVWLDRLEQELENLRAALEWFHSSPGDAPAGLRLAEALRAFWDARHLTEGRQHLARALSGAAERTAERARALDAAGRLAGRQGDYPAARVFSQESLEIERELGNRPGIAASLLSLGAVFCEMGDLDQARAIEEESLSIYRETGDSLMIATVLNNLGLTAVFQGESSGAHAFLQESRAMFRELGDTLRHAWTLNNLGMAALAEGDASAAQPLFSESLNIKRQMDVPQDSAWGVEGLAAVAAAQGQPQRAARLFGAAKAIREAAHAPANRPVEALYAPHRAAVRAKLGEAAFAAAWAEGHAMALDQAIDDALEPAEDPE